MSDSRLCVLKREDYREAKLTGFSEHEIYYYRRKDKKRIIVYQDIHMERPVNLSQWQFSKHFKAVKMKAG